MEEGRKKKGGGSPGPEIAGAEVTECCRQRLGPTKTMGAEPQCSRALIPFARSIVERTKFSVWLYHALVCGTLTYKFICLRWGLKYPRVTLNSLWSRG